MQLFKKKKIIAVHDGKFHADDIFACATLSLLNNGNIKIVRTRDQAIIDKADYVVDVGCVYDPLNKRFDHHMPGGAGVGEKGIPYAAFGLVWKEYGEKIAGSSEIASRVNSHLVAAIDADDNGISLATVTGDVAPYSIQNFLSTYRPTWREDPKKFDESFNELVKIAERIISREVIISRDVLLAKSIVEKAYADAEDKRLIVLDTACPYQEVLAQYPEPLFVVHPRFGDTKWNISTMRVSHSSFENRKSFPKAWAGLRDQELAKVSGVTDATFCHNACFLCVAKTKESAIALAKLALE
ncbi:MAG: MYG1 family protein [Candidatus Pacebacteria bacterium]|nr:MYG1 family protein [Candidatus Paceibacterota bacterium]